MIKKLALLATCATISACTGVLLVGDAFRTTVEGNTYLIQREGGSPYGVIQFGQNQQVMWENFERGACFAGTWTEPQPGLICYSYANPNRTICWQNELLGDQITLYYEGDRNDPYTYTQTTAAASSCPAPGRR